MKGGEFSSWKYVGDGDTKDSQGYRVNITISHSIYPGVSNKELQPAGARTDNLSRIETIYHYVQYYTTRYNVCNQDRRWSWQCEGLVYNKPVSTFSNLDSSRLPSLHFRSDSRREDLTLPDYVVIFDFNRIRLVHAKNHSFYNLW